MADWFFWIKAAHIISMVAWMAGLFYLPRLFVYHTRFRPEAEAYRTFCEMERKLAKAIMAPAGIATWLFGLMAIWSGGYYPGMPIWLDVKLGLVVLMSAFHIWLLRFVKDFAAHRNGKPERFFRIINEIPTVLMMGIVILVVVRPFG